MKKNNLSRHLTIFIFLGLFQANAHGEISSYTAMGTSLRFDELQWNIAGPDNSPNVLSELTWREITSLQLNLQSNFIINKQFYFRGSLDYGWIVDGKNQDSDYLADNRQLEFSRSNNDSSDGNVYDATIGAGYMFRLFDTNVGRSLYMIPMLGYSLHAQNLHMTNGVQTIPDLGPFEGLNSTYETQWDGPWLGLDMSFEFDQRSDMFMKFEYHFADYYAEADWNLRDDFEHPKSYEHVADGQGWLFSANFRRIFARNWVVGLSFDYQDWYTDAGIDRTFFSDGTVGEIQLNRVDWTSLNFMVTIGYFTSNLF